MIVLEKSVKGNCTDSRTKDTCLLFFFDTQLTLAVKINGMGLALFTEEDTDSFRRLLLSWFRLNARDLPWRHTRDPYSIWISEVMLQQTRVAAVVDRYTQFMRRFPSLVSLALAKEEDVLASWSGLGYYKRARMLHGAAQLLVNEHSGSLPKSSAELRRLPGVGDYTAAAVASIAHGEPAAAVDGNVERVLMRVLGTGGPGRRLAAARIKEAASFLLDPGAPGAFNQAMMELGAMICLPRGPLCGSCPVRELCRTRGEHIARPRKQMVSRKIDYALVRKPLRGTGNRIEVLLVQRPANASQMPGMWELPLLPSRSQGDEQQNGVAEPVLRIRHSITNTNYYVAVFASPAENFPMPLQPAEDAEQQLWIADRKLAEIPLTGLARKILMRLDVLARPTQVRQGKALPGADSEFF